jgi:hypothetical protein
MSEAIPEQLTQRENESDLAYHCLLLWAMCNPGDRSNRLIAKAINTNESNVRHWKKKFGWDVRCTVVPNAEYICLDIYRRRMDEYVGTDRADLLRAAMDVVMDLAGYASLRREVRKQRVGLQTKLDKDPPKNVEPAPKPAPVSVAELEQVDPARYMRDLAYKVRQDHLREEDLKRQIILIDAVLGLVAQRVRSGELQVSVKDIPNLLKARALLTGLPTEHLAVQQHVEQNVNVQHTHVVESARIREARKTGSDRTLIDAMKQEVEELNVILTAVPDEAEDIVYELQREEG